jgi:hypothetical protein
MTCQTPRSTPAAHAYPHLVVRDHGLGDVAQFQEVG